MIHQRGASIEEDVGDALLFGDLPDAFLIVQVGRVLGEPEDLNVFLDVGMLEKRPAFLRRVDRSVIQGENDPSAGSPSTNEQATGEEQELSTVLPSFGYAGDKGSVLPRAVVDGPEGRDFAVLTGRGNLHLLPSTHPSPSQMRVKVEVGLVLEPKFVSDSRPTSPFFRAWSRFSAARTSRRF
jgi:hypothetical protein